MNALTSYCCLAAVVSIGLSPMGEHSQERGVAVSYRVAPTFTLHEPIVAYVTIENQTAVPARIELGDNRTGNFVLTPSKPLAAIRHESGAGGLSVPGTVDLAPGERYEQVLLLNEWFRFEQLGDYEIGLRINTRGPMTAADAGSPLRFRVLPRSERVLGATCERLVGEIARQQDGRRRVAAARQLAAVNDSLATKYIRETLAATNRVDAILLDALIALGGADARAVVEALTTAADSERAAMATDALKRWR